MTSHDTTLILLLWIVKQDYKNKYSVTGDWSQFIPRYAMSSSNMKIHNLSFPSFQKWPLHALDLNTSIVVNRGCCQPVSHKSRKEWQFRFWWDSLDEPDLQFANTVDSRYLELAYLE